MRKHSRLVSTCAALACLCGFAQQASAATLQYPDLQTLSPRELEFDRADITAEGTGEFHNVLRFTNTVWNNGPGKLVMRGTINATTKDGPTLQRVYDDGGGFQEFTVGRFYWHAAHSHYHYDNWGRYQLFTKAEYDTWVASGKPATTPAGVEIGTKTTSCVLDEETVTTFSNTPFPAVFPSSGCMPNSSNDIFEGLSPGWGDTYDYWRFEQWIDLGPSGSLPDGDYVLRSVTDENNQIYESPSKADSSRESREANEGILRFKVTGAKVVDSNPPTGTVMVNNADAQTTTPQVTLKAIGRDDIVGPNDSSNVDQFRVSNDGNTWKTFNYTSTGSSPTAVSWNLADSAYGGNSTPGTKTVRVQFHDRAGNWSQTITDTIELRGPDTSSTYAQAVVADTPVSYWRLGDTSGTQAVDERSANNGTYAGAPTLGSTGLLNGDPSKAVGFDGTNDHVRAADSSSLDLTNRMTVETWIKPSAIPAAGGWASVVTKPESYSIQFNGPKLEFTVIQNGTRQRVQAPAGAVVAGQTYHVVGTFDGTTQRIYLNGAQVASRALSGSATVTTNALYMGSWGGTMEYFKGTIDEVAVYNSVLSASRISAHYGAGSGGSPPPPPPVTVAAPTGLSASPASPFAMDLRWTDNASNETSYVLERSTSSSFTSPTTITLGANATSYSDSGLNPSTTYYYRVKATGSGGASSSYSNVASGTTPVAPVVNSYSQVVLGDGPSSYWRLSETSGTTASDQKTANPGTYVNAPLLGQPSLLTSDPANRAVGVDGVSDYVRVPAAPSLNLTSQITLETWIKPNAIPQIGWASVLSKPEAYSLQFNSGQMEFTVIQNGVRQRLKAMPGAVVAGQRYHVVGTFDGVTQRLYLNGTQVASTPLSGTASVVGNNLQLGAWSGASELFNGVLDEAAVYAKVLTPAQVKAHFDSGVAAP